MPVLFTSTVFHGGYSRDSEGKFQLPYLTGIFNNSYRLLLFYLHFIFIFRFEVVTSTNFVVFDVCILSLMPFHYSFDSGIR